MLFHNVLAPVNDRPGEMNRKYFLVNITEICQKFVAQYIWQRLH